MVKDYREEVGHRTGGIKLYHELNGKFADHGIKMGRDKFF